MAVCLILVTLEAVPDGDLGLSPGFSMTDRLVLTAVLEVFSAHGL